MIRFLTIILLVGVALSAQVPVIVSRSSYSSTRLASPYTGTVTGAGVYRIQVGQGGSIAGNCIVIWGGFDNTNTPTITATDDQGGAYVITKAIDATNGQGMYVGYLVNATAATHTISVSPSTDSISFSGAMAEVKNCTGFDAVSAGHYSSSTTVDSGALAPTQSGDVVINACNNTAGRNNLPASTSTVVGSQANITWAHVNNDLLDGLAAEWGVYSSAASFTPQMTQNPGGGICLAIAMKAGSAGGSQPSGIRLSGQQHEDPWQNGPTTMVTGFPVVGNCRVLTINSGAPAYKANAVADSDGNSWTIAGPQVSNTSSQQIWYMANTTANPDLTVTITWNITTGSGHADNILWDVSGASTGCIDSSAAGSGGSSGTGGYAFATGSDSSTTNPLASVQITPSVANDLLIGQLGVNLNTMGSMTSGFGDNSWYTGQNPDGPCPIDQNNGKGHQYQSSTSAFQFTWNLVYGDPPGGWAASAVALSPALNPFSGTAMSGPLSSSGRTAHK